VNRILLAATLLLALGAVVFADTKNLQFFPKDMSENDLKAEMNTIKRSLGTNCAHCHQMKPERDMSVDTENKKTARQMLEMQKKLNEKCFTVDFLGMKKNPKATCFMCHKGEKKPEYEPKDPDQEKKFNDMVESGRKKKTCDAMKKLVDELNKNYFTWKDAPKATCWMCHRGRGGMKLQPPADKGGDDKGGDEAKGGDEKKPDEKKPDPKPEPKDDGKGEGDK
jgi:hypothetical protein